MVNGVFKRRTNVLITFGLKKCRYNVVDELFKKVYVRVFLAHINISELLEWRRKQNWLYFSSAYKKMRARADNVRKRFTSEQYNTDMTYRRRKFISPAQVISCKIQYYVPYIIFRHTCIVNSTSMLIFQRRLFTPLVYLAKKFQRCTSANFWKDARVN